MKLRIKGDSIRIRVSQSEVEELASSGKVSDVINFGTTKLTYQLGITEVSEVSADYEKNIIQINLPQSMGELWITSDQVSIEEYIKLEGENVLSILIEKDFKCLTDRVNEDESDLFENPLSKHDC